MPAALPAAFVALAAIAFSSVTEWRVAVVRATIVLGLFVAASTELLSLFRLLAPAPLTVAWVLACAVAAVAAWRRRKAIRARLSLRVAVDHPWMAAGVASIALIAAATALIAVVAPPNTYDSMTYHMARVAHWTADRSIAFYPTNIVRQLYSPPWAEYAALHMQLLFGGDRLVNLVQWFCMVASVVVASLVAKQLRAGAHGQLLAAIVVATLPMGILQASSTQTDLAVGLWALCTAATSLSFVSAPTPGNALWVGASVGLALLTKGTAYLYLAPAGLLLGAWMLVTLKRRALLPAAVMLLVPVLINAGVYVRNEATFHNPLAPTKETASVANASFAPVVLVSNLARDSALQFGTPFGSVNRRIDSAVVKLHTAVLHIGVSDPRTTWGEAQFVVNPVSFDEDYAGDFLQAALAVIAIISGLFLWRRSRQVFLYGAVIVAGFILFAWYLRWQPWHSRLELPLLVASAPLIGAIASRRLGPLAIGCVGAALIAGAVPYVLDNQTRPLIAYSPQPRSLAPGQTIFNTDRTDLYFVKFRSLEEPYARVVAEASRRNCREIALYAGGNDWEYPLWVMMQDALPGSRIDQVLITNGSADAHRFGSKPCLAVTTENTPPEQMTLDGVTFSRSWSENGVVLYLPPG